MRNSSMTLERLTIRRVIAALVVLAVVLPVTSAMAADGHNPISAAAQQTTSFTVYTLDTAKLRTGPGITFDTITNIPFSVALTAIGRNDTGAWILVDYSGQQGWVYGKLLQFEGPTFDLPVV